MLVMKKTASLLGLAAALVVALAAGFAGGLVLSQKYPVQTAMLAARFHVVQREDRPLVCGMAREMDRALTTGPVAFTVNGRAVSEAEVKLVEAALRRDMKDATDEAVRAAAKKRLVEWVVAAEQATNLPTESVIALNGRLAESSLRLHAAAGLEVMQRAAVVTDEEVAALYAEDKARREPEYRFRHIAVESEAAAKRVMELLKAKNADFAAIAGKYSVDKVTREKGGLFGWSALSVFSPEFADLLRATPVAGVGGPVLVDGHWQIVKVEETRAAAMKPLAEVRSEYESALKRRKVAQALSELVAKADVK